MSRIIVACVLALTFAVPLAAPSLAAAETKVGYVDLQEAMIAVEDGKAAKARLQKWLQDKQAELDREQVALRKDNEAFDKATPSLTPAARQEKQQQLQQRTMALSQKFERNRTEAAARERKEMEPIITKLQATVERVAEKQGIDFVLDKRAGLVWAKAKHDLTAEVIREYNAKR